MDQYIKKASILIEAIPYIQDFRRKIFVIKYGGSILDDPKIRHNVLQDIVFLSYVGIRIIIVHGGGPHISLYNSSHFEPWVHVIGGWERFRFTQSATVGVNSHAAFMAGGGLDYKIGGGRLYWRVQGDYIGANFGPSFTTNYSFGTGLVLNF